MAMPKNFQITTQLHSFHYITSNIILKTLQARLQQYMNQELPDVQAGFRKGRGSIVQFPVYPREQYGGSLKTKKSCHMT